MSLYEDYRNDYTYGRYNPPSTIEYLQYVANRIIANLKYRGFTIQRYDAYTTNSIYLKLDYGVCNSIRISDHPGKKYLKYRYNVLKGIEDSYEEVDKFIRYYYREDEIEKLISQILSDKKDKISKYGVTGYVSLMNKNRKSHHGDKGFWSQSYLV